MKRRSLSRDERNYDYERLKRALNVAADFHLDAKEAASHGDMRDTL
jgi:hypothetical protein